MGWFSDTINWKCLNCDYRGNAVINNPSIHTCKKCGSEFYVEHNNRQISVTSKQHWLEEQTFSVNCPSCNEPVFEIQYSDENEIIKCQLCESVYKVVIDEEGELGIQHKNIKEMQQTEDVIEFQEDINNTIESFIVNTSALFPIPVCSNCEDISYNLLRFNERYTSVNLQCKTCGKKLWVGSNKDKIDNIKEAYEGITKLISEITSQEFYEAGLVEIPEISLIAIPNNKIDKANRHSIPKNIKQEVWQRDGGKCIECGNNENLEYDHIIPISKGGANTTRNIQLLCENCNRTKSNKIE